MRQVCHCVGINRKSFAFGTPYNNSNIPDVCTIYMTAMESHLKRQLAAACRRLASAEFYGLTSVAISCFSAGRSSVTVTNTMRQSTEKYACTAMLRKPMISFQGISGKPSRVASDSLAAASPMRESFCSTALWTICRPGSGLRRNLSQSVRWPRWHRGCLPDTARHSAWMT